MPLTIVKEHLQVVCCLDHDARFARLVNNIKHMHIGVTIIQRFPLLNRQMLKQYQLSRGRSTSRLKPP